MGKFVWTDLSTFDLTAAKSFYRACFGWRYVDDAGYEMGMVGRQPTAGLYTMPEFFQSINMPSFWMSYIHVDDIERTVALAEQHGAKVELQPEPFANGGMVALIRDPAGAGFTCYQGEDLGGRDATGTAGRMVWNELHISDIDQVKPFYEAVFGWTITPTKQPNYYDITDTDGVKFCAIHQLPDAVRGDKEYWSVYFASADVERTVSAIEKAGGRSELVGRAADGRQYLCYDPQGAFFFVQEVTSVQKTSFKWRTILGLILVLCAILFEWNWVWGIFFLLSLIPDLLSGSTYFLEPLNKWENPILYWVTMLTWLSLCLYVFVSAI